MDCYIWNKMNSVYNIINIKNLDPNKIKIYEKSYKNIHYIWYMMVKNHSSVKINSVNPLYLIIDKINRFTKESNGNKHLMLVPTDQR